MRLPGLKAGSSVAEACDLLTRMFRERGIDSAQADARILVGHALRIDRARLIANPDRNLEANEVDAVAARATRRLNREPVARILGEKEFWSLMFRVDDTVLVPRPDTETVIEVALALAPNPKRILDIGTGSGAILLALLTERQQATGVGTDISTAALDVARANAARLRLDTRSTFIECDVAAKVEGPFDLVVSNPPYIRSSDIAALEAEVRDHEPRAALDGGADGLDVYRAIAADARRLLSPRGALVVELGQGQETAVTDLFRSTGLAVPQPAQKDLAGISRALCAIAP